MKTLLKIILAYIYPTKFKFQYAENLQWLQLTMGGIVTFDSELGSVQKMLRKPLRRLKRKNKLNFCQSNIEIIPLAIWNMASNKITFLL